ncbi:MAG: hypothetical protein HW412_845 [Bacteroidetes bacterium]|nr:hypothetical protein [Bacteroidota bacterium]
MNREEVLRKLQQLESEAHKLRAELEAESQPRQWPPSQYYFTYNILSGMILGFFGAASSLLFNVVGSALVNQHPLQLVKVYLTFPLGEDALHMESGLALAIGCGLYLATGMLLGILFHIIITKYFPDADFKKQFMAASAIGIGMWLINYYGLLSWLQPALLGGSWILQNIPWWVAALTHLVFAWTMLLIKDWGRFDPSMYKSS